MRLLRPTLLALLALAVVFAGVPAQAAAPAGSIKVKVAGKGKKKRTNIVQVGIAEEKSSFLRDPMFRALKLKIARRSVAWDTFQYDWQVAEVNDWMIAAREAGVRPIISFNRSRVNRHVIPSRAEWLAGFNEFRSRYPEVKDFAATNESNHTPPTVNKPALAAQYYKDMRKACPKCRIAAATLNEQPKRKNMETWVKRFRKALGRHKPRFWAFHNYYGANNFSVAGTKRLLKATKSGEVWITETGGLVARRSGNFAGKLKMRAGIKHAPKAWKFIFDRMLPLSPRIKRVYLFHWNASGPTDSWDSALVGADGKPRGGLSVLKARLKRR